MDKHTEYGKILAEYIEETGPCLIPEFLMPIVMDEGYNILATGIKITISARIIVHKNIGVQFIAEGPLYISRIIFTNNFINKYHQHNPILKAESHNDYENLMLQDDQNMIFFTARNKLTDIHYSTLRMIEFYPLKLHYRKLLMQNYYLTYHGNLLTEHLDDRAILIGKF